MSPLAEAQHGFVTVDGVRTHYVEMGSGPAVVLCHGFPEFWLSWRHQLPALASAGYRAIAVDLRGHGESDVPAEVTDYTVHHTVGDIIGLLDALELPTATMVGHDAGTTTAYWTAIMRPDRVEGVFAVSVPFAPCGPVSMAQVASALGPSFYMNWFMEPGTAEADLEADPRRALKGMVYHASGEAPARADAMFIPPGVGLVAHMPPPDGPLSSVTEEELDAYGLAYARTGFRGALNGYRVFHDNWRLTAPWTGVHLPVPNAYIVGSADSVLHFPGFQELVAGMQTSTVVEGAGHFLQSERPDEVNAALLTFLDTLALAVGPHQHTSTPAHRRLSPRTSAVQRWDLGGGRRGRARPATPTVTGARPSQRAADR